MRWYFGAFSLWLAMNPTPGFGATYELIRLTTGHRNTPQEYAVRCHITPGVTRHQAEVAGVSAEQSFPLATDDAKVQRWVESVSGLPRPDFSKAMEYTNWWVRSSPNEAFKLIRSNLSYPEGTKLLADPSEQAKTLAVFMGVNCVRVFDQ